VRVPLSDGPLDGMIHEDSSFCGNFNENEDDSNCISIDDVGVKSFNDNRHSYEAVALDCSFAKNNRNKEDKKTKIKINPTSNLSSDKTEKESKQKNDTNEPKMDYVLLILAGLTGGSSEGYVLDLVHTANDKGENLR
jgi:predicted alpha/beta-fold hydrolase